jgi:S-adenosylmethionine synthetase
MSTTNDMSDIRSPRTAVDSTVAEWVLPGHPDKLCDAIADRIVGEVARLDPYGQVGIEPAPSTACS